MNSTDLEAVNALEADAERQFRTNPTFMARVKWVCALAKRLDAPETVPDHRDVVLQNAQARIADLETRLRLTPDVVFAEEKAAIAANDPLVANLIASQEVQGDFPNGIHLQK